MVPPDFIRIVRHENARIAILDYSGARGDVLRQRLEAAQRFIHAAPEDSLLILLRVRDVEFSRASNALIVENLRANSPYIRATAVVGLDYLAKMVSIGARLTGRRLVAFEDEREALDWLAGWRVEPSRAEGADEETPIRWTEYRGKRVLLIDLGDCDDDELARRIDDAASIIRSEPPHSVLTLNLAHDFNYSRRAGAIIREYVRANGPYIVASAVVGLRYMKAVIPVLNRATGRTIRAFDDPVEAQDWLVERLERHSGK
jgi:hypothetical protein